MMKIEQGLQEGLAKKEREFRQGVIDDMIKVWDRERIEGSFASYLKSCYGCFLKGKILLN